MLATLFGLADGFFQPAFGGIVPLVVEQPMLASANSWLGVARNGSAIVGPAIAAGLYHTSGPSVVWAIEARRSSSRRLRSGSRARARSSPVRQLGLRRELGEGLRYVLSEPWIWTGIAAATVILMVAMAPFTALLPARRAGALPPRRRLVRRDLQRDGGRHGRRLAGLGEMAPAAATA